MSENARPYRYKTIVMNPLGVTLWPWTKQWLKDQIGYGALEKQINRLQDYGWEFVSMAGGAQGTLFWITPSVTVLFRRPGDYQWGDSDLEKVRELKKSGENIFAAINLYSDITGVDHVEAKKIVTGKKPGL